jgi:phosphoglycolate phosphatase-like HAD superfamily hydrolase
MTSVKYFETWGREPVERMLANFDGGVMHLHGNGRHLLEAVASIAKLKALYLGDDRGYPEAADVLPELRQRAATLPFVTQIPYASFLEKLERHELVGGVFYKVKGAPDTGAPTALWRKCAPIARKLGFVIAL